MPLIKKIKEWKARLLNQNVWQSKCKITNHYLSKTAKPQHDRLCIFAHFDRFKRIDPHVIHLLKELRVAGCDIVMVSTCTSLLKEDREQALKYCCEIITRKNNGYDFGSYAIGLELKKHEIAIRYRQVVMCNDSVYGPFVPLKLAFEEMEAKGLDVWGMTDSFQHEYHLQSYFVSMKSSVLSKPRVREFWRTLQFDLPKREIIKKCEVGFSRVLSRSHLKLGSWCPYHEVQRSTVRYWRTRWKEFEDINFSIGEAEAAKLSLHALQSKCNPTHEFWHTLLLFHRFPFIKVELVAHNPTLQPTLIALPEIVARASTYPVELIFNHLQRSK